MKKEETSISKTFKKGTPSSQLIEYLILLLPEKEIQTDILIKIRKIKRSK